MSITLRRQDPTRCPGCGERVTPFAAGCALSGADLDPKRWQRRPGPVRRATTLVRRRTPAGRPKPMFGRYRESPWHAVGLGLALALVFGLCGGLGLVLGALSKLVP